MLALRWFLSHLTLFILISILITLTYKFFQSLELEKGNDIIVEKNNSPIKVEQIIPVLKASKYDSLDDNYSRVEQEKHSLKTTIQLVTEEKIREKKELIEELPIAKIESEIKTFPLDVSVPIEEISSKHAINKVAKIEIKPNAKINNNDLEEASLAKKNAISMLDEASDKDAVDKDIVDKDIVDKDIVDKDIVDKNESIDDLASILLSTNHLFNDESTLNQNNYSYESKNKIEKEWGLARKAFKTKKYTKAEKHYLNLIALEPSYTEFYGELSNLYFVQNEIIKYNQTLEKLAQLYIKNNNYRMADFTINLIGKNSSSIARKLKQHLSYKMLKHKIN